MKKLILNENQFRTLLKMEIKPGGLHDKQYAIQPAKVLVVKEFLDNGFSRGQSEELGEDGYPHITPCFGQKDSTGAVIRNLMKDDMLELLKDRFPKLCSCEDEQHKFLGKVMEDWYNNKIGLYGSLSVNHL